MKDDMKRQRISDDHWDRLMSMAVHPEIPTLVSIGSCSSMIWTEPECMHRSSKLIRWAEHLSAFNYSVEHVKGSQNQFADALSRLPLPSTKGALPELTRDLTLEHIAAEGMMMTQI